MEKLRRPVYKFYDQKAMMKSLNQKLVEGKNELEVIVIDGRDKKLIQENLFGYSQAILFLFYGRKT